MRTGCFVLAALLTALPALCHADQTFPDVTDEMGIDIQALGSSAAWADIDNDGDLDLIASDSSGAPSRVYVYKYEGDAFVDATAEVGLSAYSWRCMAYADIDNDGLIDISAVPFLNTETLLFRNTEGQFQNISTGAGMIGGVFGYRTIVGDYDNDGLVDIYEVSSPPRLYRNLGSCHFEEVSVSAGITVGHQRCAVWLDYDSDGLLDLYVGTNYENVLYHNKGDGTFADSSAVAGVGDARHAEGVAAGDFNGDGHIDIYISNYSSDRNVLFRNEGDGTFVDITEAAGVSCTGTGKGCSFVDYDSDGLLDIYAGDSSGGNKLFRNLGDETFVDVAPVLYLASPSPVLAATWGDYDVDGDPDLFMVTHASCRLRRNDGCPGNFLSLQPVGGPSNRSGIGTRAMIRIDSLTVFREVYGGSGKYGTNSASLHFGLAAATAVDSLVVRWPSGAVDRYSEIPANMIGPLREGGGLPTPVPEDEITLGSALALSARPNPSGPATDLFLASPVSGPTEIRIFDTAGRLVRRFTGECKAHAEIPTRWDGLNSRGERVASGVYLVSARAGDMCTATKVVVLR